MEHFIPQRNTITVELTPARADIYKESLGLKDNLDIEVEAEVSYDTCSKEAYIHRVYEIVPDGRLVEIEVDEINRFDYQEIITKVCDGEV